MEYKVYEFTFTVRSLGKTVDEAMEILKDVIDVNPEVLYHSDVDYKEVSREEAQLEVLSLAEVGEA